LGFQGIADGGRRFGMPVFPYFLFGIAGTFGVGRRSALMALRAPRAGTRIARHLWRMALALFIAANVVLRRAVRRVSEGVAHHAAPRPAGLAVLVTMLWWIWRGAAQAHVPGPRPQ
jgi:hypothetical protein